MDTLGSLAWVGGEWWVVTRMGAKTVCCCLQVLGLEVWEQVSAGTTLSMGVLGWGPPAKLLVRGRASSSCTISPLWGMLGERMALIPLRSLSPRTRSCRKTSQTR